MFERFTTHARRCVIDAVSYAEARHDRQVTRSHLLEALISEPGPVTEALAARGVTAGAVTTMMTSQTPGDAEALATLGIDLEAIRRSVEAVFGAGALDRRAGTDDEIGLLGRRRGRTTPRRVGFSGGAKKTLELSLRETLRLGGREIRSEHIALGLLRDPGEEIAGLLRQLDVSASTLAADIEAGLRRSA